ncbi:MAG: hypothetical protein ACFCUO_09175 [Rhodospirillales bacterium]
MCLPRYASIASRFALAAGLLPIVACGEGPATTVTFRLDEAGQIARAAMASGPLMVEIRGSPYGGDPQPLATVVVEAMRRSVTWYANPRFAVAEAEEAMPSFRIVITFNGGATIGARDQCRGRGVGGAPLEHGRVEVIATFCDEEDVLADVRGWIARSDGITDRRFDALVRQVTRDMLAGSARP